ncbi:MAG: gephyrin-like molybdotransferase Glp [Pseudomonadota bacterium]
MISVEEALSTILSAAAPAKSETVPVGEAGGRVLARDIVAKINQPPFRASAMDGYAVRFDDLSTGVRLTLVGEAAAGSPVSRGVGKGEAVRIFTGGAVPAGADHVVIQEETLKDGDGVVITSEQARRGNIREAGIDFAEGEILKRKGERLTPIDLGLIAAANIAAVDAYLRPVVAYFDNGDELREPGDTLAPGEIVGSNRFAFDALIRAWGGVPLYLGRAGDSPAQVREKFEKARGADILMTVGGASVGDRDFVRSAFAEAGGVLSFSKIAVRPGKPTWFGLLGDTRVLGLPGNPASAIVCAILFLNPLIAATGGERALARSVIRARLSGALKPNGPRDSYLRGTLIAGEDAVLTVKALAREDSSLISPLASGNCLIRRAAGAVEAKAGDIAECILYAELSGNVGA